MSCTSRAGFAARLPPGELLNQGHASVAKIGLSDPPTHYQDPQILWLSQKLAREKIIYL